MTLLLLQVYVVGLVLTAIGCALIERATADDHPQRFVFRAVAAILWPIFWLDHVFYYLGRWRARGHS